MYTNKNTVNKAKKDPFFELDSSKLDSSKKITSFKDKEELIKHLDTSSDSMNFKFNGDKISKIKIENKIFTNVDLSRVVFTEVTFINCKFNDSLFIGSEFINCKFHNCIFNNCNTWKLKFDKCYINPLSFKDCIRGNNYSNIAVTLFQGLLDNSNSMTQLDWMETSDYYFKIWQRRQLKYNLNKGIINKKQYYFKYLKNLLYFITMGYGYKPSYFLISSIIVFHIIFILNYLFWNFYELRINQCIAPEKSIINVLHFSFLAITSVSSDLFVPSTDFGVIALILQSLSGIIWLGLLIAIIVKNTFK